jgi:hypothetical protein
MTRLSIADGTLVAEDSWVIRARDVLEMYAPELAAILCWCICELGLEGVIYLFL